MSATEDECGSYDLQVTVSGQPPEVKFHPEQEFYTLCEGDSITVWPTGEMSVTEITISQDSDGRCQTKGEDLTPSWTGSGTVTVKLGERNIYTISGVEAESGGTAVRITDDEKDPPKNECYWFSGTLTAGSVELAFDPEMINKRRSGS